MLPKPDKSKKQFPSDDYEPIEESKEEKAEKEKKRIQKKRRLVILSIILTVGLSFSFWIYRSVKTFFKNPEIPKINLSFKLPKFNFSSSKNNVSDPIKRIIPDSFSNISIYITDNSSPQFIWSQNESALFQNQPLTDIQNHLNILKPTTKSLLNVNLPEGLSFKEIVSDKSDFHYYNQITLPDNRQLTILISSPQSTDISSLIESIYWAYIQNSN
jgi:hypothetical protein